MYRDKKEMKRLKQVYEEQHMSEEQTEVLKRTIERAKEDNRIKERKEKRARRWRGCSLAAAAVAAFLILPNTSADVAHAFEQIPLLGKLVEVVTIRDYQYESERNHADVQVPEIVVDNSGQELVAEVEENLERSVEEINAEVQQIAESFVEGFEENLKDEQGYQDVGVQSEVINTTENYCTLKLVCYQASGSGTQWNYYYTIDLNTGESLQLEDLFVDGADYIVPISENIKQKMQEQMDADEKVAYWLDHEVEAWNFKAITEETAFYVNENGNIVISFNEGDVAPMYMGVVTFEIPQEVVKDIRK